MQHGLKLIWAAWVALAIMGLSAAGASATDRVPATEREKISYMIGTDVGASISALGPDLDYAAFEQAVAHAMGGGEPPIAADERQALGTAIRARINERRVGPGAGPAPPVSKVKVSQLAGGDVGRSLMPIAGEVDMPMFMQAFVTTIESRPSLMTQAELDAVREQFTKRVNPG